MKSHVTYPFILSIIAFFLVSLSSADIPKVISYQGKVTDSGGTPVADGSYPMRFQIYDAETGGMQLWDSSPQTVMLSGGVFSVQLGIGTMSALDLEFNQDYWLQVYFNYDPQSPRQRLGSVGYAYMASGLVPGTIISGQTITSCLEVVNNTASGNAYAISGRSESTVGIGIWGTAYSGYAGIFGTCNSLEGAGVEGRNMASTTEGHPVGVYGYAPYGYAGVRGVAYEGYTYGVSGENFASGGSGIGVYGSSESNNGYGVLGVANSTSGGDATGVSGETWSNSGRGVSGYAWSTTGYNYGVYAKTQSVSGTAIFGRAVSSSGGTVGIHGQTLSESGTGVFGEATHTTGWTIGVHGKSNSTVGSAIYGHAAATSGSAVGVRGKTESNGNGVGVYGIATATTGSSNGVWGQTASPGGYGVYYTGGLAGTGTKSCVVKTSRGPTLLYCQESPENWFEDFGEGQLSNGSCHIQLDPLFLETVTINEINPMKVFIQLRDDCKGTYVKTGTHGFEVKELQGGLSSAGFAYRVVAKRRGFEDQRLDYCKAAEEDDFLYPEINKE